jgi:hypothetical protein
MAAAQRAALNQLVSMLEEMDADASEDWAVLQPKLKDSVSADQLKRITMVIADFDFDPAGELLRQC